MRISWPVSYLEADQCKLFGAGGPFGQRIHGKATSMQPLLGEIRNTPLLWMLVFVPIVLAADTVAPHSHTLLFVLAVLAIVPLAALLSHATEAVAARTGDAVGGLL